jgi:hypothetical protein
MKRKILRQAAICEDHIKCHLCQHQQYHRASSHDNPLRQAIWNTEVSQRESAREPRKSEHDGKLQSRNGEVNGHWSNCHWGNHQGSFRSAESQQQR